MTTTYELYTNENGTPKAVEGKAPAIIERVEALETEVTGLDTALAGKAPKSHTHTIANVTGLQVDLTAIRESITNVSSKVDGIGDTLSPTYAKKQAILDACDKALNDTNPVHEGDPTLEMDDQTFLNKLAEKLSKLGTVRPLGFHYLHPYGTVPADSIICNGATYSRALYKDFFDYITTQGWVKTEAEWQEIATRDNGFCPFYSSGDGSTNFRTPKFAPYQRIAVGVAQTTTYHQAGLPNISGEHDGNPWVSEASGCFEYLSSKKIVPAGQEKATYGVRFDASRSSSVYGRSSTVQPEPHEWVMCVVAYGVATNVGSVDVSNVMSAVAQVQANLGTAVKSVNGQKPNNAGNVTIEVKSALPNYSSYVQVSIGDFTPTEDGWLRLENMSIGDYTGGKVIHKVSGTLLFEFYQNRYPGTATGILPVLAGETYTVSNTGSIYFHPMR